MTFSNSTTSISFTQSDSGRHDVWPRKLIMFGEVWKVRLVAKGTLEKEHKHIRPRDYLAVVADCSQDKRLIQIWRNLKKKERWIYLTHEIVHVIIGRLLGDCGTHEERLAEKIDATLYEVLNKNFGFGPKDS